jgi:hypothetical protein
MCAAVSNINCIRLTSHRAGKLGTDTKEGQDLWSNVKYLVGWLVGWLVFWLDFCEVVSLCDRLVCVFFGWFCGFILSIVTLCVLYVCSVVCGYVFLFRHRFVRGVVHMRY